LAVDKKSHGSRLDLPGCFASPSQLVAVCEQSITEFREPPRRVLRVDGDRIKEHTDEGQQTTMSLRLIPFGRLLPGTEEGIKQRLRHVNGRADLPVLCQVRPQ